MIVITVARKPLEGTVARNSMKWGTGGVNIDASRIGSDKPQISNGQGFSRLLGGRGKGGHITDEPNTNTTPSGRWPANLILSHLPECQCTGTKDIPAGPPTPSGMDRINMNMAMQGARPNTYQKGTPVAPPDRRSPDGTETVPVWLCVQGCPIAALDDQSGISTTASTTTRGPRNLDFAMGVQVNVVCPGGTGGASRFFKQVQG